MHDSSQRNIFYTIHYSPDKRECVAFGVDVDIATELRLVHEFLNDETKVSRLVDKMLDLPICEWNCEKTVKGVETESNETETEDSEAEESEESEIETEAEESEAEESEESETVKLRVRSRRVRRIRK